MNLVKWQNRQSQSWRIGEGDSRHILLPVSVSFAGEGEVCLIGFKSEGPVSGNYMTFFHSYFDESGKFKDHKAISFCGVLASPASLEAFNSAWDILLRERMMTCLHTKEAFRYSRRLSQVIGKETASERCESLKPFANCVLDHLDLGIIIAVDVRSFSKWTPAAKRRIGGSDDPAYFAFIQAAGALKGHACRDEDRISMMCDDDEGSAWNFYQLYRQFKKIDPDFRKKLVSISFSKDEAYPALQAADLVAALIRFESRRVFGYHPHEFGPLAAHLFTPREGQKLRWFGMIGDAEKMEDIGTQLQKRSGLQRK